MTDPKPPQPSPSFGIAQILLEDAQFRHNGDYLAKEAKGEWPEVQASVSVEAAQVTQPVGAIVRLRISSDIPEAPYSYRVTYVALLKLETPATEETERQIVTSAAAMLMPFVRETVANLTMRGRFGPTWIAPVNFSKIIASDSKQSE